MLSKAVKIQIIILLIQGVSYFGIEKYQTVFHDVKTPLDDRIREIPWTVFVYVLWFPLIAVFPVALYRHSLYFYWIYIAAIVLDIVLSTVIYYIYPTTFTRPLTKSTLITLTHILSYRQCNCMPSMHCSMCTVIIISAIHSSAFSTAMTVSVASLAILIMASTLTTKQHTVKDVVSGMIFGSLCYILGFAFIIVAGV